MRVIILGGGIIGMFSAYYLARSGYRVTVIDKNPEGGETSVNNGGLIVPSFATAPSISVADVLSTYFGRQGPVYVSPSELLRNLNWLLKARKSVQSAAKSLTEFGMTSLQLYRKFFAEESVNVDLHQGVVGLYKNAELARDAARQLNGRFIDGQGIREFGFTGLAGGVEFDEELSVDSTKLFRELRRKLSELGTKIILGKEANLKGTVPTIDFVTVGGESFRADAYVLATGAWARLLCKSIGYDPPIVPARGLAIKFDTGGENLARRPALLEDYGIPITQHNQNILRITAFFELKGFDRTFSECRKNWLMGTVRNHLADSDKLRVVSEGVGFRPCTPDQLPVIGKVPRFENLVIASGHCRLGITLAPASGHMVESLIEGKSSNYMRDFDPGRFTQR
jgi:D-amino-acid dehydrogenase